MSEEYTKWNRVDFGDHFGVPPQRAISEQEVNQDLQKPIQQLICDVHEHAGAHDQAGPQINWMLARMVSMLGRVALEHERVGRSLVFLTKVLIWLTIVLTVLTVALVWKEVFHVSPHP